jgi:hypothetical protein
MNNIYSALAIVTFSPALSPALAGEVLAISGVVYAALQALKKAFPVLSGWPAVGINVALSILGAVIVIPQDQLFSLSTLTTLLVGGIAAAGAAGVHGTVQNLAPASVQAALGQTPPSTTASTTEAKQGSLTSTSKPT